MNNYIQWLKSTTTARVLLVQVQVEVSGVLQTKYLSTAPVTVDSVEYLAIVKSNISISNNINIDYTSSISFGDIELANNSGMYDSWMQYIWTNKSCKVYYGGIPSQPTNQSLSQDYELIFDGIVEDIDAKSLTTLNLKIRDKLEKLNYPVTDQYLGNQKLTI